MILIRGIKGESFARSIEIGKVGCRDLLSSLLEPPITGYRYSDYYEKNLVKAITACFPRGIEVFHNPEVLRSILVDYYLPHIYMSFFHILNNKSIEWLDNFDDDYCFIAINVKLDRITKTAIGKEYFGAKMTYADSIRHINPTDLPNIRTACLCSIEDLFPSKKDMYFSLLIYNTIAFPLLCREINETYTDIENEFRIIAYDCPRFIAGKTLQNSRSAIITGKKTGNQYVGTLTPGHDSCFKGNMYLLNTPNMSLDDILLYEDGMISIDSQFKSIDITDISDEYYYLGGKEECAQYIKKMLINNPKNVLVDRTVQKTYDLQDLKDVVFLPGIAKIDY